jgi:hypothetical protein
MKIIWFVLLWVFVCQGCAKAEDASRRKEIQELPAEYQALGKDCLSKESFDCCMQSVRNMADGKYALATITNGRPQCPQGYVNNMLRCIDSYTWCQPKEEVQK